MQRKSFWMTFWSFSNILLTSEIYKDSEIYRDEKKQWPTSPTAEDEKWPLWPYSFSSLMVWWRDSLSLSHTRFLLQTTLVSSANHKHIFSQKDKLSNTKSSFFFRLGSFLLRNFIILIFIATNSHIEFQISLARTIKFWMWLHDGA